MKLSKSPAERQDLGRVGYRLRRDHPQALTAPYKTLG
jgi:hypothetical protein